MMEQGRDLSRGLTPQPTATGHTSPAEPQPRELDFPPETVRLQAGRGSPT